MKSLVISLSIAAVASVAQAAGVIAVSPCDGDATQMLQEAINKAAAEKGKPVTIKLAPGNYDISLRAADNVKIEGNVFEQPQNVNLSVDNLIESEHTSNLSVKDNRIVINFQSAKR